MLAFSRLCNVEICGGRWFKDATDDGNLDAESITAAVETEMLVFCVRRLDLLCGFTLLIG